MNTGSWVPGYLDSDFSMHAMPVFTGALVYIQVWPHTVSSMQHLSFLSEKSIAEFTMHMPYCDNVCYIAALILCIHIQYLVSI